MDTTNPTMDRSDRLYELVPVVYRLRDADQGYPLRALLRVIAEQVNVVEDDIAQLYENWFIETCQDWVVPYIGSLIGYKPVLDLNELSDVASAQGQARNRILIPRAEVANTIRFRRRKGTVSLLESLASAIAGWPAKAIEFYRLLGVTQNINYLHLDRGRSAEIRDGDALENLDSAFDEMAHTVDVRRISSPHFPGRPNIPHIGVYVWRLNAYSVTKTPAYCYEEESPNCFMFSVLGNDAPLYTRPRETAGLSPGELDLPIPIRRRSFETQETGEQPGATTSGIPFYYGDGKSLEILMGSQRQAVSPDRIVAADLSDWNYRPTADQVAVDPALGRIMFPPGQPRKQGVWVSYFYGFSADMAGGEYDRTVSQPNDAKFYLVGEQEKLTRINDALTQWQTDAPMHAVIEITDSGVYVEPIRISLNAGRTLQLRAANHRRPVIRLLDWQTSQPDDLSITGAANSFFTLDGLLITGRGVQVNGDISGLVVRHCTLVPGWALGCDCEPKRTTEASLELIDGPACLTIEHSILGAILVDRDEVKLDPMKIRITDSIIDSTSIDGIALGAPGSLCAHADITILRSTVFGQLQTRALELAENSILMGMLRICRRQQGCVRFCYVAPGSRAPRRYECQPDLVLQSVDAKFASGDITATERDSLKQAERMRVEPGFNSTRYGSPTYAQLSDYCAQEIVRGAEDESEMGVFHNLYQQQRAGNLRARLNEYVAAGMDVGIIFAS
jgi:hypothetical protein